jgi:crotonobetainyl-CoA:carnitine CoA-transferase CaiB-like acyl-CoA transferase
MPGPLEGFVVVEACQMVAGPLAGAQLADLGAEVIKIENPVGGDRMRYLGHRIKDIGALWSVTNRGKRSVVLDLQTSEGVDMLKQIVATADVFIQNFRPGVVERLGIDEPALRAVKSDLIYVSVSGFGDDGPYADQKTYDYVVQAISGMAAVQSDPTTGTPALLRNIVIDKTTAGAATQAVLAALLARARGAGGQHVQISMLDVAVSFLWPDGMMQHTLLDTDRVTAAAHMADGYAVRQVADGFVTFMAQSNRQFPGICRGLGRPEWADDPRFATLEARESHLDELDATLAAVIGSMTGADVVSALLAQDVPCAIVNPVDRVHLDPQVIHNGTLVEHERLHLGLVREPVPPIHFGATPSGLGRHAPRLDEHTDEVLGELGFSAEKIADARTRGVIGSRRS